MLPPRFVTSGSAARDPGRGRSYAFTINMELGLLVMGGRMPHQVERHFEELIDAGHLSRL